MEILRQAHRKALKYYRGGGYVVGAAFIAILIRDIAAAIGRRARPRAQTSAPSPARCESPRG